MSDRVIRVIHSTACREPNLVPGTVMGAEIQKNRGHPLPSWGVNGLTGTSQWGGGARGLEPEAGSGPEPRGPPAEGPLGRVWGSGTGQDHGRGASKGRPLLHSLCLEMPQEDGPRPPLSPWAQAVPLGSGRRLGSPVGTHRGGWAWRREEGLWHREQQAHRCPPAVSNCPCLCFSLAPPLPTPPGPPPRQ